jgi:hypothetical protein
MSIAEAFWEDGFLPDPFRITGRFRLATTLKLPHNTLIRASLDRMFVMVNPKITKGGSLPS